MPSTEQAINIVFNSVRERPDSGDKLAIIQAGGGADGGDRNVTFGEFQTLQDRAIDEFKAAGVKAKDRVLLTSPNTPELAASIAALWRMGAIAVPVDFRLTEKEVENVANMVGVKLIAASSRYNPNFASAYANAKAPKLDLQRLNETNGNAQANPQKTQTQPTSAKDIDVSAEALVILTSGTTGVPKGAVHDLHTLMTNLCELGPLVRLNHETKVLLPLPLSHIFGLEVFMACFIYGAPVIFADPQSFFACAKKYQPSVICGVPTLYGAMLTLPPGMVDLQNTEYILSGGAPLPLSLAQDFEKKYGKRLSNGYGSTESKIISLNTDGPFESVGKIIKSVKVEILNDNGDVLPLGETGEITISGTCLMLGYLDNPDASAQVLKNGRYHTGDMGRLQDGYLYISGRSKEMIVVAGNKVFPSEVEDVLRQHPSVKEVAVVGMPNKQLGQIVKAVVVLVEGEFSEQLAGDADTSKTARQALIAQFKEHCKTHLKRELRPMDYDFMPASKPLPKTSSGKIDKKLLAPSA
jgi:long-chain acyl-CoA synthetase